MRAWAKAGFLAIALARAMAFGGVALLLVFGLRHVLLVHFGWLMPGLLLKMAVGGLVGLVAGYAMQTYQKALKARGVE